MTSLLGRKRVSGAIQHRVTSFMDCPRGNPIEEKRAKIVLKTKKAHCSKGDGASSSK